MSRNATILQQETVGVEPGFAPAPKLRSAGRPGEYSELVRRLFRDHSVVALIGAGAGARTSEASRCLAAELADGGARVVIVDVRSMLRTNPLPPAAVCRAGHALNVFIWPGAEESGIEFFPSAPQPRSESDWLGRLRREFDAVLFDCPALENDPAASGVAALADGAVLVVEAGQTRKHEIRQDERALRRRDVKLVGCVLIRRR